MTTESAAIYESEGLQEDDCDMTSYSAVQIVEEDGRVILRPPQPVPILQDIHESCEIEVDSDVELEDAPCSVETIETGPSRSCYLVHIFYANS